MSQMRMPRIGAPSHGPHHFLAVAGVLVVAMVSSFSPSAPARASDGRCEAEGAPLTPGVVRGTAPELGDGRPLAAFRNADRICQAVWVPAIDDGFVPQGLAVRTETEALLSGYLVDPATGLDRQRCAVIAINVDSGQSGPLVDLGARPSSAACRHAGGITIAPTGEVILSDHRALFVFDGVNALFGDGQARRVDLVGNGFAGSFLAPEFDAGILWVGSFANSLFDRSPLEPVPLDVVLEPTTTSITRGGERIDAPRAAQGAGWDGDVLAVVSSGPRCGQVAISARGDDETIYEIGPGAQTVALDGDRLLVVHEAGAIPYPEEFFPVVAVYDVAQLRDGSVCLLLPSRDLLLLALLGISTVAALLLAGRIRREWSARRGPRPALPTGRGS